MVVIPSGLPKCGEGEMTTYYKVLSADGKSQNGGDLQWSLPTLTEHGWKPGKWHTVKGKIKLCDNGLHLTDEAHIWNWYKPLCVVYEAQASGKCKTDGSKVAVRSARLIKPYVWPAWWQRVEEFVLSLKSIPWLTPDGNPDSLWKLHETRDAARDAAWDAAWDATQDAARDAAWDAARGAAWDAARDAARDAAWDAAWGAAWDAARDAARDAAWDAARDAARDAAWDAAWDAARDATLECVVNHLYADLVASEHQDYAARRFEVWRKGYGCICDINGVLYVYKSI